jgi:hypothetical protein
MEMKQGLPCNFSKVRTYIWSSDHLFTEQLIDDNVGLIANMGLYGAL